ncbi:hypothetical protein F2P56_019799 [Juglans regia]|uniref:Uncharacterized protein LOC108998434 n=2 Tax=Juglans regia TaxID=51240 RepID=A0A2I4FFV9_JUGRE|nr:uncharacterized protein LOC108998434 [Juglans regia]KAF5459887.1 hypothetical protein F2P56_019799 [Juglans regia]
MGKAKFASGLGFRDLESFNIALLAKQDYRLLQRPDALLSKILKFKYFPHFSFFEAKIGSNPSYIWSIHATKNLELDSDEYVFALIDLDHKYWNTPLIDSIFSSTEAEIVKKIPIRAYNCPDRVIWRCLKNGIFSVKNAYHLHKEMVERAKGQGSSFNSQKDTWLNIPNATKVFTLKACLESLPTKANLFKKTVVESPDFPICLSEAETIIHTIWDCHAAKDVWSTSSKKVQKSGLFASGFMQSFSSAKKIWQRRNSFIFQDNFIHPNLLIQQAKQLLTEYQEGQASKVVSKGASKSNHTSWEPLPLGTDKVNWDAAAKHEDGRVGIGIVIRDFEERVIASRSMQRYMLTNSYTVESQGALQAIIFARDIGFRRIILEGDALQFM